MEALMKAVRSLQRTEERLLLIAFDLKDKETIRDIEDKFNWAKNNS